MTDPLAEKLGINVQGGTVNVQNLNLGIAERLEQSGDHVRILVVAANPLGSSPLKFYILAVMVRVSRVCCL